MALTRDPASSLVVVTGASSGIGLELALLAARDGHPVLLVARGVAALEEAAVAVRAAGSPGVHVLSADLGSDAGIDAVVARVEELDLPVAALVNNAGFGVWGPFAEQDPTRIAGMVDLNDRAVVLLSRHLLERVRAAGGGILTVASTAAFQPGPGMAVYHASKAFALFFSVALREELRGTGVRVTALCPGPVPTKFADTAGVEGLDDVFIARLASQPADKVARMAWEGLAKNTSVVTPGALNKVSSMGAKVFPMKVVTRIARGALGALDATGAAKR
ncbi:MAG: short-chain dehydrogenase [Thermoleophilia bacterium]|nr:short-chain dehydrogenase [Thermoleophilia bacterium]